MKWTNVYGLDQLGSFLQKTRKEKGYTQDEFAEIIGASHATLSALENGKGVSSQTLMRAISDLGSLRALRPKCTMPLHRWCRFCARAKKGVNSEF